jgi:hypothetical protein
MRALAIAISIIALGSSSGTLADHKPGHQIPPAQLKKHTTAVT